MPAGRTYEPIQTTTLTTGTATVTFSSIPATYTDLIVVANVYGRFSSTSAAALRIRLNGDTSSNYSVTTLLGNGSTAYSGRLSSQTYLELGSIMAQNSTSSSTFPPIIFHIFNYTNTTRFKTILSRTNSEDGTNTTSRRTGTYVGLWRKAPEAINSIEIGTDGTDYVAGSTFTLYGITAA